MFVDINIKTKSDPTFENITQNVLTLSKENEDYYMCNISFTSYIYILRCCVCPFVFKKAYHISIVTSSIMAASFYPNKREKSYAVFTPGHIYKKVWHKIH